MSKYLKKYNKETNEWELVSAPDVSVVQKLEDGSNITDTNVIVTNPNYAGESGETPNLNETLTVISDDISRLQRNVSWLAEHGGGGGGGGTGPTSPYGIVIISPILVNDAAYVSGKTFEVEFMITGGTDGEECAYSYQYDSDPQTDYATILTGESKKILIDNTDSPKKEHSITIRARNPYGTNITPKGFRIYESIISLAFDAKKAGGDYNPSTQVFNIRQDSTYADMPLLITNGLMKSDTVIVAKCQDQTYTDSFTNETTDEQQRSISLWKLFPDKGVTVGYYYTVSFQATATLGSNTITSNEVLLRIYIISPSEISIVLGVNGTSGEIVDAPLKSSLVYNFKVYTPPFNPPVESTYYSAKISNNTTGEDYLILGKYFDETLKEDGATFSSNDSALIGRTISAQLFLNGTDYHLNDILHLYVKVWSIDGTKSAVTDSEIHVVKESNEVFPRQYNKRSDGYPYDTIFLSWNNENGSSSIGKTTWTSKNTNYGFLDRTLEEEADHTVIADINVLNNNAESVIKTDGITPYLRLQNRAYAVADLATYANEVAMMTSEDSNLYGFTISFTLRIDNHNDTQHTVLLWGRNNADGTLADGIKIDTDKAQWVVNERKNGAIVSHNLTCHISTGTKITVDFSYVRNTSTNATARIYVNGILNAATDLEIMSPQYMFPSMIYFGANYRNNAIERYADLNIYEFSVYTKSLNDMQISINGKNAKFTSVEDYTLWKDKNFISANEDDPTIPESVFFTNGKYITDFDTQQINNIAARSKIPTLYLNFPQSSNFTSTYFYQKQTSSAETYDATATYFDPDSKRDATFRTKISLQGTSTLGYRIKNLEMYMNETFVKDGETHVKLFQPKKEWLPESQFTLKADVVDSAHANNAILGEWINNSGVFKNNPAMDNYGENKPQDWDDAYSGATTDAEREAHTYTDDPETATIKHTLEGFPFLMFIKFSDKSSFTFLGIYSFNLGRYSYYNMGMKFLKGYSRRDGTVKVACPKVINYYEEMPTLGNISAADVFSFEMGNAGNLKIKDYPVWSQYDRTVVQSYGSFRYLGSPDAENTAWTNLCALFEAIAKFEITAYNKTLYPAYQGIKYYTIDATGHYQTTGNEIEQTNEYNTQIVNRLSIENAVAYFIVANAFGMTDSLGKNLTIRTWDGGQRWWFCFYDMDTALALANDGSESNPVTVSIDKVTMRTDSATSTSILETTYHDENSKYAAVLSKIWGIFRDDQFLYLQNRGGILEQRYEYVWNALRCSTGKLSSSENFTNIMAARVDACGEMIYNYDYNTKYIQDTAEQDDGAAAAITFLHGTRVEYVRDWLRKHFYFLDGIFDYSVIGENTFTYIDSPYNSDITTIVANYSSSIPVLAFTVQVSSPSFIGLTVGSDDYKKYYIDTENVDTVIYFLNGTSSNSQLAIRGSSTLCKFDGLNGGFQAISDTNQEGVAKTLSVFDASSSSLLNDNPFYSRIFGTGGKSSLETVNLSNTRGSSPLTKYEVDLTECQKLIEVNISNSDVTSLVLPSTSLQRLNVAGSNIVNLSLSNQAVISSINLEGCNKLSTVTVSNCNALETVNIADKPNLSIIRIQNNQTVSAVTISNCPALAEINIGNNPNLKRIYINNCTNINLEISIYGCTLEEIRITGVYTTKPINLPERSLLSGVTLLDISNDFSFGGFRYGSEEIETYGPDDKFVFDLTPFTSLDGSNILARNVMTICYIRVPNVQASPFNLRRNVIEGSGSVLRRIFGHILITDNNMFKDCTNFYIREKVTDAQGKTPFNVPIWQDGDYATNITIATDSLNSCFEGTNCSLSDVYYIFNIAEDVITMTGTFASCKNVVTTLDDNLSPDLFTHTPNLENIDFLFNDGNIGGYISEDILIPIISGITTFNNVFGNNEGKSFDDKYKTNHVKCFFPEGNVIEEITGFNPVPYNILDPSSIDQMFDNEMLRTLTEIKVIDRSFNDAMIDFGTSCELLQHATKLVSITTSFLRMKAYGTLDNIFGGKYSGNDKYPQVLESITNSFSFLDTCDHGGIPCPIIDDESHWGVLMPIGNSFLGKIKSTIKNIGGVDKNYRNSFYAIGGRGLKKYIDLDDCDGENFCYDIFRGCNNLEEIPNLFNGLDFGVTGKTFTYVDILYGNNGSMFSGLTKLKNVSGLFSGMKNVKYRLSGSAFKDCVLEDASFIFAEGNESYHAKKTGQIPFKLFYEEATGSTQSSVYGISEATADALGITDGYVGPVADEKFMFSNTYTYCRHTIKSLINAFEYSNSLEVLPYSAQGTGFNDWVEDNVDYNPVKFYMAINGDTATYTLNPDYNPYKKIWNRYVYDGTVTEFNSMVVNSTEYQALLNGTLVDDYGNPLAPTTLPDEFQPNYSQSGGNDGTISMIDTGFDYNDYRRLYSDTGGLFPIRNYLCAPDIFRYCANSYDTSITSIFQYGSPTITIDGCGIKGTIPPFIFEPISEVFEIQGVFSRCRGVLPYKWARYENGVKIENGILYPPTMLSKLKNLYVFANVFSNTTVWGNAVCPEMFSENTLLSDINGLWSYATWVETVKPNAADAILQFPITLFTNNSRLTNVASLFSMGGPRKLEQLLFTYVNNPKINNCSGFLYRGSNVSSDSTVPTFWVGWVMSDFRNCYYGIDSNIISTQNIPEQYWKELS